MKILLLVDRGNSGGKFLAVMEDVESAPFKIPSVTRKVDSVKNGIKIEKSGSIYLCGDTALSKAEGIRYTPLDENDKIRDLSVAVAAALIQLVPNGGPIELSLAVSSPIFYQGIEKEIEKEMSRLDNGFSYNDIKYSVLLERVGGFQEGVIFLENNRDFNGVIDLGQGTLLAGVRYPDDRGVVTLPLSDSDIGGCNLILQSLLKDDKFLKAVKKARFTAAPSFEKLSSLLSRGKWEVRDIDFKKFLKPHLKIHKQRIENAAQSIRSEIRNATSFDQSSEVRIALIGGGSSLLQGVLGESLTKWCDSHNLVLYKENPDYQTVIQMYEALKQDDTRLVRIPAPAVADV